MTTLQDQLLASSERKLTIRTRADLSAERKLQDGEEMWVVKDPVSLKYFHFQPAEYFLLRQLERPISLSELKRSFEQEFPPEQIEISELHQFLLSLHQNGLVNSEQLGQGKQLFLRGKEKTRKETWAKWSNILAIRFKGIDPDRLLTWMYPYTSWIYSWFCVIFCWILISSAALLVLVQFDEFTRKLPHFQDFFTIENMFWLSVVLGTTKVIHEFGHGLTCKHYGGECHEMGFMFLVLTPCLYCNVSDSWMLPNKYHRMAIAFAGIYVELVLASIATFLWWFSEPGLLHHLSLNIMLICSVSTILFNGNPLLRYDGYYILADWLEIANLQQQAQQTLYRALNHWCLGIEPPNDPTMSTRKLLLGSYALASMIYRWFVMFSILFFLNSFLAPYGLKTLGQMIMMISIGTMVGMPSWKLYKYFRTPGRISQVKKLNFGITVAVVAVIIAGVMLIPLPHSVYVACVVEPEKATSVFVKSPGTLKQLEVLPGAWVEKGALLAKLENPAIDWSILEFTNQIEERKTLLENLWNQRFDDPQIAGQIPQAKEALVTLESRLNKRQRDQQRLTINALRSGYVFAAPEKVERPLPEGTLASWTGHPLKETNQESFMETGTLLCTIGDPAKLEAVLVIDQADIEFIREDQQVTIQLDQYSGNVTHGTIRELAQESLKVAPRALTSKAGGRLATETDESGNERPLTPSYQARVPLDNPDQLLRPGLRGRALIHAGTRTLGEHLYRYFNQTFHFKL